VQEGDEFGGFEDKKKKGDGCGSVKARSSPNRKTGEDGNLSARVAS
jgi:hypothetical protein